MNARNNPGSVVGWRDGEFLYSAPGGRMINALGIIIEDTVNEAKISLSDDRAETNDGENEI